MKTTKLAILLACLSMGVFTTVLYQQINQRSATSGIGQFEQDMQAYAQLGGDFSFKSVDGTVSLSQLWKEKIVLLYFGFTRCPDICPSSLINMQLALEQLKPSERSKVQTLLVSTDPEYDTTQQINDYVRFFIKDAIGISSSLQQTKEIAQSFGAFFSKVPLADSALGYTIDHTTRWYLIQPSGKIGTVFDHNLDPDEIAKTISIFARQIT